MAYLVCCRRLVYDGEICGCGQPNVGRGEICRDCPHLGAWHVRTGPRRSADTPDLLAMLVLQSILQHWDPKPKPQKPRKRQQSAPKAPGAGRSRSFRRFRKRRPAPPAPLEQPLLSDDAGTIATRERQGLRGVDHRAPLEEKSDVELVRYLNRCLHEAICDRVRVNDIEIGRKLNYRALSSYCELLKLVHNDEGQRCKDALKCVVDTSMSEHADANISKIVIKAFTEKVLRFIQAEAVADDVSTFAIEAMYLHAKKCVERNDKACEAERKQPQ